MNMYENIHYTNERFIAFLMPGFRDWPCLSCLINNTFLCTRHHNNIYYKTTTFVLYITKQLGKGYFIPCANFNQSQGLLFLGFL